MKMLDVGIDVERTRQHLYRGPGTGAVVTGTQGSQLVDGLETMPQEVVIIKKRFSPFFHTPLDMILRRCGP
jgi:nicotinamidase-related amidase